MEERPFVYRENIKYNELYLLPWHLHNIYNPDSLYMCRDGEVVKMEYLSVFNIDYPSHYEMVKMECMEIFGIDFDVMRAIWKKRRPDLPFTIWYKVKMHLQWK